MISIVFILVVIILFYICYESSMLGKRWIITNKLKINDSKTECIVFRSPQLKYDLSGLSENVGECW